MVGPGSAKPAAPAGGQQQSKKAAGVAASSMGSQTSPKLPSAAAQKTEVLNQARKLSVCPAKIAVGVAVIGYFTLCPKKKPEATDRH